MKDDIDTVIARYNHKKVYEDYKLLAGYYNPKVSWSSPEISNKIDPLMDEIHFINQLIAEVRPNKRSISGLNVNVGQGEEFDIKILSYVYTLIKTFRQHSNWSIITSNLLTLMDLPDAKIKIQVLHLLQLFVDNIDRTGLTQLFLQGLKVNILFIEDEQVLMNSFHIAVQLDNSIDNIVDLLNTVLVTLDKKFNRSGESPPFIQSLVSVIDEAIDILGPKILISLNRINFIFNQMLINSEQVENILNIQMKLIGVFEKAPLEARQLFYEYRFDLIACWTVLQRREVDTSSHLERLKEFGHNTENGTEYT